MGANMHDLGIRAWGSSLLGFFCGGRRGRGRLAVVSAGAMALGLLNAPAAMASSVSSAAFTGGAGSVSVGGTLFAKNGAGLTLTVNTTADTQCVDVAGAFAGHQTSATAKSSWTFGTTAGSGNGAQAVTATASKSFNVNNGNCTGASGSLQASYVLDNTGPVVTAALTPAANAAGWNNTDTVVKWTATDAGSGVAATQPFQTDPKITQNGIFTKTAPAQSDRLGNTGAAGSVTVRVDEHPPSITAAQTKNSDGTTTVTFTCSDPNAGGGQASGIASCLADGSTTNAKTVQPGVTVTGTATDNADNTSTTTSTAPAGDTTAPTLSGTPTTSPNNAGWYSGDVTVHWTAADPESGIPTPPADTTITGEGKNLTSTTTVKNGAGLSTTATSSPAVNIDRTAPTTGISGTSNNWVNGAVTVSLTATDNLSGIASTSYTIDGGGTQTGSSFTLSDEGDHTVTFFSTDKAGNAEATQTAHVKIDKTAPTISHSFTPLSYTDGAWTNGDVTVSFSCADQGGSGVAGCTDPVTKSAEGSYTVTGTATDGAGNSATDNASVRIDKTPPTITATAGGTKNAADWYNHDVTVTYTAGDDLSGVSGTPADDVLGEGANQSASATVTDAAGNSSSASVTGINVDETDPVLKGTFTDGWHTGDVTVNWSCTDALSGPASQPADDTVTGEGDNLTSTASCTDVAGNTTTKTVSGIKIDRTAPTTTASVPDPLDSGWYGNAVPVTLTGHDGLSGIDSTFYSVDGGDAQAYTGAFSFDTEGTHSIAFWSTDVAGNVETAGAPITLKVDTTAPTTTVINPISPESGWFVTSGIPVAFDASDGDGGSGIQDTFYTIDGGPTQTYGQPFNADLSTGTHTITYWSVDLAGNVEAHATTNTIAVNVDTDAPTISGVATPAANSYGWNNTNVDVAFSCADVGSGLQTGVAGCAGDTTLTNDGADQTVHGTAVDVAGNTSGTDVGPVNIDTVKPTLSGSPTTDPSGTTTTAVNWYKGDVSIAWTGVDKLSGIDPDTQPANSTITGEGTNLGAGPVTIADKAGNVSYPASVTGINIDRTAPVVTGVLPAGRNAAGWYRGDVTVGFSCVDPVLADGTSGSGVAACPSDILVKGDGANQSVTSAPATDVAGNASDGKKVNGINIDGHAPQTTADNQCTATNAFCKGSTATVVLSSSDVGPSGVKEIHYTINGGADQVAAGASKTLSIPTDGTGHATFTYYAVDNAGNVEPTNTGGLDYDNVAPTVTHTVTPAANAAGWNNGNVTVHFDAKDTDPGSGVVASSVTPDVTINAETPSNGTVVNGYAIDTAGNLGTDSVTVKLDKTAPSISGAIVAGATLVNGWYTGAVKVHFTCSDALSGVAVCPDDVTVTSNGANQSVSRSATDAAGNTASATVSGISIDNENPTVTSVNVANGSYTLGGVPTATCTATDSFSGVASCKITVTGGNPGGVGTFSYTAIATDRAGNTSAALTGTYAVIYRFDGFLQPINDTAHQTGIATSVFKAGSTVPVKFQLKNASGQVVQSAAAPVWLTPLKGSAMSVPVDESLYTATADSGTTFKYDTTAQQYIYTWKTGSGGNYWQIGVRLDDGQTYYVNIGLR
jgi:hypothetical protein